MSFMKKIADLVKAPEDDYIDEEMMEEQPETYAPESYEERYERSEETEYRAPVRETPRVVNFNDSASFSNVALKQVTKYDDATEVANLFKSNRTVCINTEACSDEEFRKVIFFLMGVVYALDGNFNPVASHAYLLTPHDIAVSGKAVEDEDYFDEF